MSSWFPLFVNLEGKRALIIGAGSVAARRAAVLSEFGCRIRVVAPNGSREMERLCQEGKVSWDRRMIEIDCMGGGVLWRNTDEEPPAIQEKVGQEADSDAGGSKKITDSFDKPDLVIIATNDPNVNNKVAALCRQSKILVNHAGDQGQCDFYFPGIVKKGRVVVGVTASGNSHRQAKQVTKQIRDMLEE